MIVLGPFLIPSKHPDFEAEGFTHTGYSMEMVFDDTHHLLPIYRDSSYLGCKLSPLDDFCFPEPNTGWPVEFSFRGFHDKPTAHGRMVSVSPLLMEIFRSLKPAVGLEDFLRDFRKMIPVSASREPGWIRKPTRDVRLADPLTKAGFVVAGITNFGVSLTVDIAWCFGDDYDGWQKIDAGQMEFRPRCGKLNDGKWNPLKWRETIEAHFGTRFEAIASRKPIDCLRADEDIENLLAHFEWTPTTMHSEKEIRQMRIAFVNASRHLWEPPKELAAALHRAELYSRSTSIHQIVKFLPSLLTEADRGESGHLKSTTTSTPEGSTCGNASSNSTSVSTGLGHENPQKFGPKSKISS